MMITGGLLWLILQYKDEKICSYPRKPKSVYPVSGQSCKFEPSQIENTINGIMSYAIHR